VILNLDALVNLRQTEIAQLEDRLASARELSERQLEEAEAQADADALAEAEARAEELRLIEAEARAQAEELAAIEAMREAEEEAEREAESARLRAAAEDDAAFADSDADGDSEREPTSFSESVRAALAEAGESIGEVDLVDPDDAAEESAAVAPAAENTRTAAAAKPAEPTTWYENILGDKTKLGIAGVGALGLAGVVGTLLFRRRRGDEELIDFDDEVEFIDENGVGVAGPGDMDDMPPVAEAPAAKPASSLASAAKSKAGAAGAAAAAALAAATGGSSSDAGAMEASDADDTLSEVDVYLAYGLHGQAQELLTGALAREPDNPDYMQKLLQSYHAQGNAESFNDVAGNFEAKFGESHEAWSAIAGMGHELDPSNARYSSGAAAVESMGGGVGAGQAIDDDFLTSGIEETDSSSETRDFATAEAAADFDTNDESEMMDQSLDPAFAFDESDLEATGDFSQIADELSDETNSVDLPDFDDVASDAMSAVGNEVTETVDEVAGFDDVVEPAAAAAAADEVMEFDMGLDEAPAVEEFGSELADSAADSAPAQASLDDDVLEFGSGAEEPLDLGTVADELTLDLEQLSGDMEIDSTELLDDTLGADELEIPDLTSEDELLTGEGSGIDNTDEMDTMMDLAKAYIDMGDKDSASSALGEIVKSGTPEQVSEAETLLRKIS